MTAQAQLACMFTCEILRSHTSAFAENRSESKSAAMLATRGSRCPIVTGRQLAPACSPSATKASLQPFFLRTDALAGCGLPLFFLGEEP
jgi:hypothetical protein